MKLNWLKHWKQNGLVALVIVLFSELGLHFVISDFRISLAVVLFPFFLLTISRETPAWEVGVATGAAVWVFRALYSTARGTVLANAALANLPGGLYYVFYGLLFGLIVRQRYVYHYNKLWYQIALCDFLANVGEVLVRLELEESLNFYLILAVIALGRGVLAIVLLAADFFLPLRLLGSYFHIAMNGAASAEKIFKLLAAEEPANGEQTVPEQAALQLKHVTFGYEKDRTILQDVSLTIPQGSFVSLVGESGCGKSTIAALLSGSRTGYTGSVTLGGVPVEQLQRAQRLRALTLVPHNATIFKGTVEANLRMAKPDATEAELWAALEQVNLADFCRSQDGLQTALHEGGSNLSGGQRQRLAMARALLHDTPIYLFDEATSNVDAESENDIMAAIRSLAGRKTVILISHRLANVVDSDCIYVLDKGRIAERGTHAELLKKQGAYSRLYTAQKQLETLETEDA